jgi:hypothetical protein
MPTKAMRAALPKDWQDTLTVELADHGRALKALGSQPKNVEDTF